jgi:hypothetical protein
VKSEQISRNEILEEPLLDGEEGRNVFIENITRSQKVTTVITTNY